LNTRWPRAAEAGRQARAGPAAPWRKPVRERKEIKTLTATAHDHACHPQDGDVRVLIEALPPRLRSTFLLRYYAGLSDAEIVDALGCRRW